MSGRDYYLRNRERVLASVKLYADAHRDKKRAYNRAYYAARRDELAAVQRAYDLAHRSERRAYDTVRATRPERIAKQRVYADRRRPKRAEYLRTIYRPTHREQIRLWNTSRKARLRGALGSHTVAEWLDKIALLGGCCIYCGRSDRPLTRDHKVPLIRGGSNAIENVVPACGSCNSAKKDRTAVEFIASRLAA